MIVLKGKMYIATYFPKFICKVSKKEETLIRPKVSGKIFKEVLPFWYKDRKKQVFFSNFPLNTDLNGDPSRLSLSEPLLVAGPGLGEV